MEAWEVLERAADKIEQKGWCQGDGGSTAPGIVKGLHCAISATGEVFAEEYQSRENYQFLSWDILVAAEGALAQAVNAQSVQGVFRWNDAPGRTKEEVTSLMRACAASLKAARTEATRQHAPESTVAEVATGDAGALEHVS